MTNRFSVPLGSSTVIRRICPGSKLPALNSTVPVKVGPSFLTSHTTGNQLASRTTPS